MLRKVTPAPLGWRTSSAMGRAYGANYPRHRPNNAGRGTARRVHRGVLRVIPPRGAPGARQSCHRLSRRPPQRWERARPPRLRSQAHRRTDLRRAARGSRQHPRRRPTSRPAADPGARRTRRLGLPGATVYRRRQFAAATRHPPATRRGAPATSPGRRRARPRPCGGDRARRSQAGEHPVAHVGAGRGDRHRYRRPVAPGEYVALRRHRALLRHPRIPSHPSKPTGWRSTERPISTPSG